MAARPINGEMLRLARNRRKKTQTDLAEESGVAQAAISRIENGTKDALSLEEIQAVARSLRFPVSFFYEDEPFHKTPLSIHGASFRKKASASMKDLGSVVALANLYAMHCRELLQSVDMEPEFPLLQFEVIHEWSGLPNAVSGVSSASEAAKKVRAAWQLGNGALLNLVRFVEATGVLVVESDFEDADVDGITLRPTGMRPIIVLNGKRPADRKRFSLAHEYGHVVLHSYPYEAMETEANEFAAELLMPRDGIVSDLRRGLSIPKLGQLKMKWRTSMASLIYRAKTIGAISSDEATSLFKLMSIYGYRIYEPAEFDVPEERGRLVRQLIDLHLTELGYSMEELAEAVKIETQEFALMHGLSMPKNEQPRPKPKLRLVVDRD